MSIAWCQAAGRFRLVYPEPPGSYPEDPGMDRDTGLLLDTASDSLLSIEFFHPAGGAGCRGSRVRMFEVLVERRNAGRPDYE